MPILDSSQLAQRPRAKLGEVRLDIGRGGIPQNEGQQGGAKHVGDLTLKHGKSPETLGDSGETTYFGPGLDYSEETVVGQNLELTILLGWSYFCSFSVFNRGDPRCHDPPAPGLPVVFVTHGTVLASNRRPVGNQSQHLPLWTVPGRDPEASLPGSLPVSP